MSSDSPKIINSDEVNALIRAFLSHKDRKTKGATEEEIIRVINWAHDIKIQAAVNISILHEIYIGKMTLDICGDTGENGKDIYLSYDNDAEPVELVNIEKVFSLDTFMNADISNGE